MLIYIQINYSFPNIFRQTPGGTGWWKDMEVTTEDVESCDFLVVFNHPIKDINIECRKGGRLLIIQEPPYKKNLYLTKNFRFFDRVYSGFSSEVYKNVINFPAFLPWHINKSYDELMNLDLKQAKESGKKDKISWVTSNANVNAGHEPRLKFLEFLKNKELDMELFGRGINPIDDKFEGVFPFKYTIAIENYSAENYWTEKIADALLSWTMPIYYGCKNILDYFPKDAIILIDIEKPEESYKKIMFALENDLWSKNLPAIEKARNLILNEYQFFPGIYEVLKRHKSLERKRYFIPSNPSTFLLKLKNYCESFFK